MLVSVKSTRINMKRHKIILWWGLATKHKSCYQNLTESALPDSSRGIVIFVKLFRKLFDSIRFSSATPFVELHDAQLHGSLSLFSSFDRSFSAGPSFMPKILIKCSSVNIIKPSPSMLCSRKFC